MYNEYWDKIKHLFRNYVLSSICIICFIYAVIYIAGIKEPYVYKDDATKIEEIARFKEGSDSMYVYKIENNNSTYISLIKK